MYVFHKIENFKSLVYFLVVLVTPSSKSLGDSCPPVRGEDAKIAKLVEMGFKAQDGKEALRKCEGNIEVACEMLANTPTSSASGGFINSLIRCCNSDRIRMYK